jgi:subtilisin family serine protease
MVIAVLDTGIDLSHPAFAGRLVQGKDFVDGDDDPSEVGTLRVNPTYGHGTHVAGIVALMAPDAKIMPIRVLDQNGESDLWKIKDALIWAANHGADVVNMSLGYPQGLTSQSNTFIEDLTHGCDGVPVPGQQTFPEFNDEILVIVAGAGNGGQIGNGADRIYPAAERGTTDDNILSVGSSSRLDLLSTFSTMANVMDRHDDRWVRTVAPGEDIISAIPGGRYGVWSGTSMSAPIVSGIAALVLSVRPLNPPTRVATQIVDEVEETGFGWKCHLGSRDIMMETSRVDAFCAVTNNQACYPNERQICNE